MYRFRHKAAALQVFLRSHYLILLLLLLGIIFKLYVTSHDNFIFHTDSARDWVDVREMVEVPKLRLIGQTSGIEGIFTGPGWYYLLSVPYILSGGDPYSAVVLMIVLWAVGGFYLYKLTAELGVAYWLIALFLWLGSPFVSLATVYSFNPNPTLLLYPLFIFALDQYIRNDKVLYGLLTAILAGTFFQLEMYPSFFMPVVIFVSILFFNRKLLKTISFYGCIGVYLLFYVPQLLFDLRHDFLMTRALMRFLNDETTRSGFVISDKVGETIRSFMGVLQANYLNNGVLTKFVLLTSLIGVLIKPKNIQPIPAIALLTIGVTFLGFAFSPAAFYSWHLGPVVAASIVLFVFALKQFEILWSPTKYVTLGLMVLIALMVIRPMIPDQALVKASNDPSNFANELKAVEYAYQQAQGKNFRVYAYLPSVIDYPYQSIIWWYGMKQYGYTPSDYAYLPDVPDYIGNKDVFIHPLENGADSGLVILIMEPDRIGMRSGWEGVFAAYPLIERREIGPLVVETRSEVK